jgi:putative membrane protein
VTAAHKWTLAGFLVIVGATWWRPIHPAEQALHHSLTVLGLLGLLILVRRAGLPYASFCLVLIFLILHSIAARWIYSFVPYDDWTQALFGVRIGDALAWQRNHFDRLVHFSYGVCLGPVLWRHLRDRGWRVRWAALVAVDVVLSTSALYELFEWGIAMTLAPGVAEAYNGQQGDLWDAQKDMSFATSGALVAVGVVAVIAWSKRRRPVPERALTHA